MKIKKKKIKVNIDFVLSLKQKQFVPFWNGEKLPIFSYKYFSREKCDFFSIFAQNTGRAGQIILKLSTKRNQVF